MFSLINTTNGELGFRPYKNVSSDNSEKNDDINNIIPIIKNNENIISSYRKWVYKHIENLENIEDTIIQNMYDVVKENDIPVKIYINTSKLKDMLYKRIYKTSYNTSKKWCD
jgi:hypothetical protein